MATNYQAYMQSRNVQPQIQNPQMQYQNQNPMPQQFENPPQMYTQSLGMKEVDGLNGVNRYPVAPGASVALKDVNSMTMFVKSTDLSGALLPLRVFELHEVTQEYQDRETPVSRAEFNQMSSTMAELASVIGGMKQMLEDLTAPSPSSNGGDK